MQEIIKRLSGKIIDGGFLQEFEAKQLLWAARDDLSLLLSQASRIRWHFRGNKVGLCSITNAKSGGCSQDCSFCAQSSFYNSKVPALSLINPQEMLKRASLSYNSGARRFCFVTSGAGLDDSEIEKISEGLRLVKNSFPDLKLDASLGFLTKMRAQELKQAGLSRYNHNLETSERFFSKICTTHKYNQRLQTVQFAKEAGLEICCGGIFGLGESEDDRLKLALALRELAVDCIPINFLNPVSGTPLENQKRLSPEECLKIIAIFRFIHPAKEIKVCGGRESVLGDRQSQIFSAGADSIILGDYLTTKGNSPVDDFKMIESLGLRV